MNFEQLLEVNRNQRATAGFLGVEEILVLAETNTIYDPFSLLISTDVSIGSGNCFYPNVVIEISAESTTTIGNNNKFFPNSLIRVTNGQLSIGSENEIGEGGAVFKIENAATTVADNCRISQGAQIQGTVMMGKGSQILGGIKVRRCTLGGGNDHRWANPNERGAVLKGFGTAEDIELSMGDVIFGKGAFLDFPVERQETYHKNWAGALTSK